MSIQPERRSSDLKQGLPLLLLIILILSVSVSFSQTALTGGLRGIITDSNGSVLSGAAVTLENRSFALKKETVSDAKGQFVFLNLTPATDFELTVAASGFKSIVRKNITVISAETNVFDAVLEVAAVAENVDVNASDSLQIDSSEISQIVGQEALNDVPLYNRSLHRAAMLTPKVRNTTGLGSDGFSSTRLSINGRIYRETHYKLDGNANFDAYTNNGPLQTVSLSSVQEYKILSNQYSAEHGGTTAGFLLATTKSGTKELHGELFFTGRPSGTQARMPLSTIRTPNQMLQFGGSVSGPIFKDKTLYFINYEGMSQDRGSYISLPSPGFYMGKLREHMGLFKLDHHFSDLHSASIRFNGHYQKNDNVNDRITFNAQSAQQVLPSTAVLAYTQTGALQFNDNYVIKSDLVNEFRISYTNAIPSGSKPADPSLVIIRPGISTEGNGSFAEFRLQNTQIVDQMSWQKGQHSLKFGGDYTTQSVNDRSYQQFGTYTLDQNNVPTRFQQTVASDDLQYGQTRFAAFLQDDWRISPFVTLNLGLRYDYQSLIKDHNNFGPRAGFAFDVGGKGTTVVRGGIGMYYDQPFFHGFTQRYLLNSPVATRGTITLTGSDAANLYPNSYDPRSPVPQDARRSLFLKGDGLKSPYSWQFTVGIQQKLSKDWLFNADYAHIFSRDLLTAENINAPSPFPRTQPGQVRSAADANATRPFDQYLNVPVLDVLVSGNYGRTEYNGLTFGVSRRFGKYYRFVANYVVSESKDAVTDDHLGANPNEWSSIVDAEFSPSDFNQRHRFVTYGTISFPYDIDLTLVGTLASGVRVNALTGVDNNGDGRTVDRPVGFTRNSFEGDAQKRLDLSIGKFFDIPGGKESTRFEIRMDIFNIFNNSVFHRFNNVYGNGSNPLPTFLEPIGGISNVDPARQIQFTGRLLF